MPKNLFSALAAGLGAAGNQYNQTLAAGQDAQNRIKLQQIMQEQEDARQFGRDERNRLAAVARDEKEYGREIEKLKEQQKGSLALEAAHAKSQMELQKEKDRSENARNLTNVLGRGVGNVVSNLGRLANNFVDSYDKTSALGAKATLEQQREAEKMRRLLLINNVKMANAFDDPTFPTNEFAAIQEIDNPESGYNNLLTSSALGRLTPAGESHNITAQAQAQTYEKRVADWWANKQASQKAQEEAKKSAQIVVTPQGDEIEYLGGVPKKIVSLSARQKQWADDFVAFKKAAKGDLDEGDKPPSHEALMAQYIDLYGQKPSASGQGAAPAANDDLRKMAIETLTKRLAPKTAPQPQPQAQEGPVNYVEQRNVVQEQPVQQPVQQTQAQIPAKPPRKEATREELMRYINLSKAPHPAEVFVEDYPLYKLWQYAKEVWNETGNPNSMKLDTRPALRESIQGVNKGTIQRGL